MSLIKTVWHIFPHVTINIVRQMHRMENQEILNIIFPPTATMHKSWKSILYMHEWCLRSPCVLWSACQESKYLRGIFDLPAPCPVDNSHLVPPSSYYNPRTTNKRMLCKFAQSKGSCSFGGQVGWLDAYQSVSGKHEAWFIPSTFYARYLWEAITYQNG